jgi:DNA processing protein
MFVLDINSAEYPSLLKEIKDPPKKLYIKGNFDVSIFQQCLSVVGSRKMSEYGRKVTQVFVSGLAGKGITIVSGFMYGIDAEAHRAALSVGGRTIAVMPCGIDLICPDFQQDLYTKILDSGGLVISEYANDIPPKAWTFPRRNRIVAGLSQALLVVEAGGNSGSLITADVAKRAKRRIFTIPGSVFYPGLKGNWQLAKEGATMAVSSLEIEKYYYQCSGSNPLALQDEFDKNNFSSEEPDIALPYGKSLDPQEREVFKILAHQSLTIDQLFREIHLSMPLLMSVVTSLSIKGFLQQDGDRYYAC